MTTPSPIKVIRIVKKPVHTLLRTLSILLFFAGAAMAFWANHVFMGDSTLFALLVFAMSLLVLVGMGRVMTGVDVTMTEGQALAWLQQRKLDSKVN